MKLPTLTHFIIRVTTLDILFFTKHLSVMLKSGIPLSEAVTVLKNQTKNTTFKEILENVQADIENGKTLEKSLSKHHQTFSSLYTSLIGIGEKSGNLEDNLEYLAKQLKKSYDFNKKIQGATLYPKLILASTAIMGTFLSLFVLPKLVDLFTSLEVKLPLSTKILLFVANLMKDYGFFIAGVFVGLFAAFSVAIRTTYIKPKWQKLILAAPFIGPLSQNIEMASFCRNMGIMLKSGLTIIEALKTEINASDNLIYKRYFEELLKIIEKGGKLSDEISSGRYHFIPPIVGKMLGVGEETGKLEDVFIYLGDFFEEDVDETTRNLSNILEPVLLLAIGLVVGFVSLAIISPIYQLTGGIRR